MVLVAACVPAPAERIAPVDDRPSLMIANAPSGARLMVDGADMGEIGDSPVLLEPGTHLVSVTGAGGVIHSEKLFLGGRGTRILTVPAGAAR
jgi:hypothetical protein